MALSLAATSACWALAACGGGGGGTAASASPAPAPAPAPALAASDLAVLIAEGDATSEAIALAYQRARGIPDANLIRLAVPRGSDSISTADFAALKASLDAKLPATAQAMLLTWTQPSRVATPLAADGSTCSMGITSALTLGYDARLCGKCVSPISQAYYNVDTRKPWTDLKLRPSMMLGASTLAEAQVLIARGVAADASMLNSSITPQAWLVRTTDANRSTRFGDFQQLARSGLAGVGLNYVDNAAGAASNEITGKDHVMVYMTGLENVTQAATNTYLPGAVADTLTSYGGYLPDALGQMPITTWLKAGVTGSYGTQEEPCNFSEKFMRATVLVARYRKGETLIEAMWKSVQAPGQGLFIGEPLARPWAVPP